MRSTQLALALILAVGLLASSPAQAEEQKISGEQAQKVRDAIAAYIQKDTSLKGGFFLYDPELKRVVELKFDHVHQGVTRTAAGQFFACVDMRAARGPLYDVDVYLKETAKGLEPTKLVIHKVDGQKTPITHPTRTGAPAKRVGREEARVRRQLTSTRG